MKSLILSLLIFTVTAYCPCEKCCGEYSPEAGGVGLTAMGEAPIAFLTAATGDRALLGREVCFEMNHLGRRPFPLGFPFNEKGCVRLNDLGGAVKGERRIDLFVPNHEMAKRFGRKRWKGKVGK